MLWLHLGPPNSHIVVWHLEWDLWEVVSLGEGEALQVGSVPLPMRRDRQTHIREGPHENTVPGSHAHAKNGALARSPHRRHPGPRP